MEIRFAPLAAVIGSILALLLRKYTPELSLTVTILAGDHRMARGCGGFAYFRSSARDRREGRGIDAVYLSPVLKCIGIGMITHLAAQVCRDAQQGSIASAVELCGTLCALYISLPLIRSLLAIVEQLL